MAQRRFHKKSRYGCSQCKNNRTKCDESRPYCGRCERAGLPCSLSDPNSDLIFILTNSPNSLKEQANTESPGSSTETSNGSTEESSSAMISSPDILPYLPQPQITDLELERLRLLNHYTLYTVPTITALILPSDGSHSLWREWVTTLALTPGNNFLLHGLLGLSALHLALMGHSSQQNTLLAVHYHTLGISLLHPRLTSITISNYDSVFAFSCITAFYSFGIHRSKLSSTDAAFDSISRLQEVLVLIKGSSVMLKSSYEMLEQSRWSIMITRDLFSATHSLPEEIESMLSLLLSRVPRSNFPSTNSEEEEIYVQTIHTLRSSLSTTLRSPHKQMSTILIFPNLSPAAFWSRSSAGEGLSKSFLGLSILANYAVSLYWLRENIWMKDWGSETVEAVKNVLPADWQDCIAWAVGETNCETAT